MNIDRILNSYIDLDYKKFQEKICSTKYVILGVKIPTLRHIAKDLLKRYNYQEILNNINNISFEHVMLKGLVVGTSKISYEQKLNDINNFLPLIDNWAICDIFVSSLKEISNHKEAFLNFLQTIDKIDKEYYQRFIYVVFLNYYIEEEYLPLIFNKILNNQNTEYYTLMAASWCLSICLIKYFSLTTSFLKNNEDKIDIFIYNKSLQKGIESYRIDENKKKILRSMKMSRK